MTLTIDLTNVEAWEAGDILPPGTHYVEVASAAEGTSSNGNPQLELEMRAVGGEYEGGTIRDWIHFTPKTAGKVKQVLGAFGVGDLDSQVSLSADDLLGKRAQILVRTETYDGKERTKIKAYEAAASPAENGNGSSPAKSDSDDLPF